MTKVEIRCPKCGKIGDIEISDETIKNVTRGLLAVNIASKTICEHSFIAYIDKNLSIRDYFIADFQIEIPEISPLDEDFEDIKIHEKEIVDIDLIKLNLNANLLTYAIKSILSKQKILIILNEEFLYQHILDFFNYITRKSFEIDISLSSAENYKKNKKNYKDVMVFKNSEVIKNNSKIINPKKLWVEKQIVNQFMSESGLGFSYIKLKNELQKAYRFSKEIIEYCKQDGGEDKINALKIKKLLETKYKNKIDTLYLNFLLEVVRDYFGVNIPSLSESVFGIL